MSVPYIAAYHSETVKKDINGSKVSKNGPSGEKKYPPGSRLTHRPPFPQQKLF
jgi:hypothetical protein